MIQKRNFPDTAKALIYDLTEHAWSFNVYWDYTHNPKNPVLVIETNNEFDNMRIVYTNRGTGHKFSYAVINYKGNITYKQVREFVKTETPEKIRKTKMFEDVPLFGGQK